MNVIKQILVGPTDTPTVKMIVRDSERGPQGFQGERGTQGPQGIPGPRGLDGAIQYKAGTGINITDDNVIEATGEATATWGGIQGNITDQTDLQNALSAKQDTLEAGTGIDITDNTISVTNIGPTVVQTTGTSTTSVMSQNAVTTALAGKANTSSVPVITMTTTDPGEGATLAANSFIAVYSASQEVEWRIMF